MDLKNPEGKRRQGAHAGEADQAAALGSQYVSMIREIPREDAEMDNHNCLLNVCP